MRLYDCSLSTDVDKSLSVSQHQHGINDSDVGAGGSLKHFHDLSCSMLVDGEQSISISKVDLVQAVSYIYVFLILQGYTITNMNMADEMVRFYLQSSHFILGGASLSFRTGGKKCTHPRT